MPTIGGFHAKYWGARANVPAGAGAADPMMYPGWQASVVMGSMFGAVQAWWERLVWLWVTVRRLRLLSLTSEQLAVVERAVRLMQGSHWAEAQRAVQACASSPKFHKPEQWVEYSRAVKANPGQAQNVFRHLKVVQGLRATHSNLTNPEAHFLAELAYQGFARIDRRDVQIVQHQKRLIPHAAQHVTH